MGTGHADTTKHEWASNLHRDSYASYIGHPPLLAYMAVGMGESRERVRAMMIEVCFYESLFHSLMMGEELRRDRGFDALRGLMWNVW